MKIPCCDQMRSAIEATYVPIVDTAKVRELGIRVIDGGDSSILIHYCPWCGTRLPNGLREQWFNELETRDIDPFGSDIPAEFLDDRWYQ